MKTRLAALSGTHPDFRETFFGFTHSSPITKIRMSVHREMRLESIHIQTSVPDCNHKDRVAEPTFQLCILPFSMLHSQLTPRAQSR